MIDPRVGYVRDSFVAMALVLDLMAATGETLSSLVRQLPRHIMIKDQYPLARSGGNESAGSSHVVGLWERIAAACPDAHADLRDGLRLDWQDSWVHMRASNTEPIVRVIAEATEAPVARELADRAGQWIRDRAEGSP